MSKVLFSIIILVIFTSGVSSQNAKVQTSKITRTVYSYSFSGVQNEEQLQEIKKQVSALQFVESVKTKFKVEKQAAEIILIVAIESNGSEEQKSFEPAQLKQIILKNNFTPGDFNIRTLENQQ